MGKRDRSWVTAPHGGRGAATMRVSNMTVYRLIKSGQLAAIRVGRTTGSGSRTWTGTCRSGPSSRRLEDAEEGSQVWETGDRLLTVAEVAATMRVSNMTSIA